MSHNLRSQFSIRSQISKNQHLINRIRKGIPVIVLIAITCMVMYPFLFVILTSLKTDSEVLVNPLGLPRNWLWENYRTAWVEANFSIYFKNSVIILVPVVITVTLTSVLAGYAFSWLRFRWSNILLVFFIAGLGLPLEAIIIPLYLMMKDFGLLNNYLSVILPQIGLLMPFGILIMSGFFSQLPTELVDAAKVDGATSWQTLFYVLVPIASPAIISLVIFASLWTWNSFFLPTVMLTRDSVRTLPLGLAHFMGEFQTEQARLAAGALITAAPIIILYLLFQRQFIRGITVGSMK
jgi:raffinose/stachyose/melibiose transport system permease protein